QGVELHLVAAGMQIDRRQLLVEQSAILLLRECAPGVPDPAIKPAQSRRECHFERNTHATRWSSGRASRFKVALDDKDRRRLSDCAAYRFHIMRRDNSVKRLRKGVTLGREFPECEKVPCG